ncbi:hypothetical protein [Massilia sp. CT11-137]|uniref:hypothetical protein n=1 Tax=Massilia sp. CT11-137 TaxID=3393901 RepID=UPI0039AEC7D4
MTALERLLIAVALAVLLAVGTWFGIHHYGTERYEAGYAAAVDAGKKQHDRDAYLNQQTEDELRTLLAAKDADAYRKEQEYASNLEAAQRRVRAGTDRLRCPATSTVQSGAAPEDRSASGAPAVDGGGPDLVPEAAADVLGYGAAIAGLVSRYAEVVERNEACRAVNAK